MANRRHALPGNAPGPFFVDATCIDCDTCRQLAPLTFVQEGEASVVRVQPVDAEARLAAGRAAAACPMGSIGTGDPALVRAAAADFPLPITDGVWYLGHTSRDSYGASSYLLAHPQGNWLVDSPRWSPALAEAIAGRGPVAGIFLTHSDDVADAPRYAARFAARRVIHAADRSAQPDAEQVLEGSGPIELAHGLVAVPVPGHTPGSLCLHAGDHLFSGDHLWWSRGRGRLMASRHHCWDWQEQAGSMERLARRRFSWLLPGHGGRHRLPVDEMQAQVHAMAVRMRAAAHGDDW